MKRISKEPDIRRQELMDIGFELYMKNGMKGFGIKRCCESCRCSNRLILLLLQV